MKVLSKETGSVILSDPSCKDVDARFTMVHLKPLSDQQCERYCLFYRLKSC